MCVCSWLLCVCIAGVVRPLVTLHVPNVSTWAVMLSGVWGTFSGGCCWGCALCHQMAAGLHEQHSWAVCFDGWKKDILHGLLCVLSSLPIVLVLAWGAFALALLCAVDGKSPASACVLVQSHTLHVYVLVVLDMHMLPTGVRGPLCDTHSMCGGPHTCWPDSRQTRSGPGLCWPGLCCCLAMAASNQRACSVSCMARCVPRAVEGLHCRRRGALQPLQPC